MTPAAAWPDDPAELAEVAIDPERTAQERERALTELAPVIRRAAEQVGANFRGQVGQDLIEESVSHVARQLAGAQFDPSKGTFGAWLREVLYNRGCDLRRQRRRRRDPLAHAHTGQVGDAQDCLANLTRPAAPDQAKARQLEEEFIPLRDVLEALHWPATGLVNYRAVWLFDLRLLIGGHLRRALGEAVIDADEFAARIEGWLPWHPDEEQMCFRPDWKNLRECWQAVRCLLAESAMTAVQVVEALAPLAGSPITLMRWYQWVNRARQLARERIPAEQWREFFARWVPQRSTLTHEAST